LFVDSVDDGDLFCPVIVADRSSLKGMIILIACQRSLAVRHPLSIYDTGTRSMCHSTGRVCVINLGMIIREQKLSY
jgi:hypothetical protein